MGAGEDSGALPVQPRAERRLVGWLEGAEARLHAAPEEAGVAPADAAAEPRDLRGRQLHLASAGRRDLVRTGRAQALHLVEREHDIAEAIRAGVPLGIFVERPERVNSKRLHGVILLAAASALRVPPLLEADCCALASVRELVAHVRQRHAATDELAPT